MASHPSGRATQEKNIGHNKRNTYYLCEAHFWQASVNVNVRQFIGVATNGY